jgi:hypothetical protein
MVIHEFAENDWVSLLSTPEADRTERAPATIAAI